MLTRKPMVSKILPLKWIFCILLLGVAYDASGQDDTESAFSEQLWTSFNPSYKLTEKKQIKGDIDYRTISPPSWNRFIVRGGMEVATDGLLFKKVKKIKTQEDYTYGLGFFYLNNFTAPNSLEIRPYQGYRLSFRVSDRLALGQYVRLEERFVFSQSSGNVFGLRLRYQILGTFTFKRHIFKEGTFVYFPVGVEFFFNIRKTSQFNDVLRISPGIGYQVVPGFKLQGGVAYHYTLDEAGEVAKSNDLIFQFKLFKTLNFGKKAPPAAPKQSPGETDFQEL